MSTISLTVIDDGVRHTTKAVAQGDSVRVPAEVIGFELKPEGLCRSALDSLEAPDFSLPDLEGNLHSLTDRRGKKVLLVAYASW